MQAMPADPAPLHTSSGRGDVAPGQVQRVDEPGRRDDRRAVLVVVEHRDVHQLAQPRFDDEALRRLDVLQVDAAEGGAEKAHAVDEFVDVFGRHFQVDRIDVGEALEQHRLAFHHRLGGQRPEIAQPQDRRAVADHRHQIAARRVVEDGRRVLGDRLHRHGHARRIGQRQVALGRHRLGRA